MSYYLGLPIIFLVAISEASVLPMFLVLGLQPNPTMVLLLAWLMVRGANEAFVLIPFGGLVLGLVDSAPLGTTLLALAPMALLQEARGRQLREGGIVITILFVLAMTLVYNSIYLLILTAAGDAGSWASAFGRAIIPVAIPNVAILLPLYGILWLTSTNQRRVGYV